jgi:hypothetical protein
VRFLDLAEEGEVLRVRCAQQLFVVYQKDCRRLDVHSGGQPVLVSTKEHQNTPALEVEELVRMSRLGLERPSEERGDR